MAFCLFVKRFSTPSNQTASLSKLRELNSAIFFSSTLNQRLSFLKRLPLQVAQVFSSINFSTHSLMASVVPLPVNQRFSMGMMPSKMEVPPPSPLASGELSDESAVNVVSAKSKSSSSPAPNSLPYNNIFKAACGRSLIGLSKLILFLFAIISTLLNM